MVGIKTVETFKWVLVGLALIVALITAGSGMGTSSTASISELQERATVQASYQMAPGDPVEGFKSVSQPKESGSPAYWESLYTETEVPSIPIELLPFKRWSFVHSIPQPNQNFKAMSMITALGERMFASIIFLLAGVILYISGIVMTYVANFNVFIAMAFYTDLLFAHIGKAQASNNLSGAGFLGMSLIGSLFIINMAISAFKFFSSAVSGRGLLRGPREAIRFFVVGLLSLILVLGMSSAAGRNHSEIESNGTPSPVSIGDNPDTEMMSSPKSWAPLSPGWAISYGIRIEGAAAGVLTGLLDSITESVKAISETDEKGDAPVCSAYVAALYQTYDEAPAAASPGMKVLRSYSRLMDDVYIYPYRMAAYGNSRSAANSWCRTMELEADRPAGEQVYIAQQARIYNEIVTPASPNSVVTGSNTWKGAASEAEADKSDGYVGAQSFFTYDNSYSRARADAYWAACEWSNNGYVTLNPEWSKVMPAPTNSDGSAVTKKEDILKGLKDSYQSLRDRLTGGDGQPDYLTAEMCTEPFAKGPSAEIEANGVNPFGREYGLASGLAAGKFTFIDADASSGNLVGMITGLDDIESGVLFRDASNESRKYYLKRQGLKYNFLVSLFALIALVGVVAANAYMFSFMIGNLVAQVVAVVAMMFSVLFLAFMILPFRPVVSGMKRLGGSILWGFLASLVTITILGITISTANLLRIILVPQGGWTSSNPVLLSIGVAASMFFSFFAVQKILESLFNINMSNPINAAKASAALAGKSFADKVGLPSPSTFLHSDLDKSLPKNWRKKEREEVFNKGKSPEDNTDKILKKDVGLPANGKKGKEKDGKSASGATATKKSTGANGPKMGATADENPSLIPSQIALGKNGLKDAATNAGLTKKGQGKKTVTDAVKKVATAKDKNGKSVVGKVGQAVADASGKGSKLGAIGGAVAAATKVKNPVSGGPAGSISATKKTMAAHINKGALVPESKWKTPDLTPERRAEIMRKIKGNRKIGAADPTKRKVISAGEASGVVAKQVTQAKTNTLNGKKGALSPHERMVAAGSLSGSASGLTKSELNKLSDSDRLALEMRDPAAVSIPSAKNKSVVLEPQSDERGIIDPLTGGGVSASLVAGSMVNDAPSKKNVNGGNFAIEGAASTRSKEPTYKLRMDGKTPPRFELNKPALKRSGMQVEKLGERSLVVAPATIPTRRITTDPSPARPTLSIEAAKRKMLESIDSHPGKNPPRTSLPAPSKSFDSPRVAMEEIKRQVVAYSKNTGPVTLEPASIANLREAVSVADRAPEYDGGREAELIKQAGNMVESAIAAQPKTSYGSAEHAMREIKERLEVVNDQPQTAKLDQRSIEAVQGAVKYIRSDKTARMSPSDERFLETVAGRIAENNMRSNRETALNMQDALIAGAKEAKYEAAMRDSGNYITTDEALNDLREHVMRASEATSTAQREEIMADMESAMNYVRNHAETTGSAESAKIVDATQGLLRSTQENINAASATRSGEVNPPRFKKEHVSRISKWFGGGKGKGKPKRQGPTMI